MSARKHYRLFGKGRVGGRTENIIDSLERVCGRTHMVIGGSLYYYSAKTRPGPKRGSADRPIQQTPDLPGIAPKATLPMGRPLGPLCFTDKCNINWTMLGFLYVQEKTTSDIQSHKLSSSILARPADGGLLQRGRWGSSEEPEGLEVRRPHQHKHPFFFDFGLNIV